MLNRFVKSLAVLLAALLVTSIAQADPAKIRVLVITGGHGFEQKPFYALFDAISDVTTHQTAYPQAGSVLKPDLADKFDVVVFYDMWAQGIPAEQQAAFVKLLERGIGVVALHHTLAAHQNWSEYAKIIGGKYHTKERMKTGTKLPTSGYHHGQTINVHVANTNHPITRGLKDFEIHDETYNNYDTDPNATVLLTTDHPKSDPELAWVKEYKKSRVVYIELGHDHLAYEHPSFRTLVARSIRWTAGRLE